MTHHTLDWKMAATIAITAAISVLLILAAFGLTAF